MSLQRILIVSVILSLALISLPASSQSSSTKPSEQKPAARDGQHDFDFDFGAWQTHTSRLMHPLTGSKTWLDMEGVTVGGKVWDGRANIAEYKADGPAGHMELIALRTYNPEAHQWNVNFATPNVGTFGVPCVGEFKNGRGEFYDQEQLNGKYIMVRFSISKTGPDSAQSEQAFSEDGGKTWEVNWINKYKRLKEQPEIHWSAAPSESDQSGAHDFAFSEGSWHT